MTAGTTEVRSQSFDKNTLRLAQDERASRRETV